MDSIENNVVLSIIIENVDKDYLNSTQYRRMLAKKLKYNGLFELYFIENEESYEKKITSFNEILEKINGNYFCIMDANHSISNDFISKSIDHLKAKNIYLLEPYKFMGNPPKDLKSYTYDVKKYYLKDTTTYGVLYNTNLFKEFYHINKNLDKSTWYINYRIFYSIQKIVPFAISYSTHSDVAIVNGIKTYSSSDTLFLPSEALSLELKLYILRYLLLAFRRVRNEQESSLALETISEVAKQLDLDAMKKYTLLNDKLEIGFLNFSTQCPTPYEFIYKKLDSKDVTFEISTEPPNQKDVVLLYQLMFTDLTLYVTKKYADRNYPNDISSLANFDFYSRKINKDSIFIFMDRTLYADDNAEHLYEYFINNYPEYKHAYFALHKNSNDWLRLKLKGFNLLPLWSKEFYDCYLNSDVFISSQIYNLDYKGKNFSNSRFVYLQHGVILNDMRDWIISKYFDLFITTGENEENYLKSMNPVETINTGLPRFQKLEKNDDSNVIVFMPTWRFNLNKVSDTNFRKSEYFTKINDLINDSKLLKYLRDNNLELMVKLHPNVSNREHLFQASDNISFTDKKYSDLISDSKLIFTDYSSVVVDAAFIKVPIAYYQFDYARFFDDQPYEKRVDFESEGMGPVFMEHSGIIDYIVNEDYLHDREIFDKRREVFFRGVQKSNINKNIIERILNL